MAIPGSKSSAITNLLQPPQFLHVVISCPARIWQEAKPHYAVPLGYSNIEVWTWVDNMMEWQRESSLFRTMNHEPAFLMQSFNQKESYFHYFVGPKLDSIYIYLSYIYYKFYAKLFIGCKQYISLQNVCKMPAHNLVLFNLKRKATSTALVAQSWTKVKWRKNAAKNDKTRRKHATGCNGKEGSILHHSWKWKCC